MKHTLRFLTALSTALILFLCSGSSNAQIISTVAGNGTSGYSGDGGAATAAELNSPYGVAVDAAGNIYIADASNYKVRKVNTSGIISVFAGNGTSGATGDGGAATAAELSNVVGVAVDASNNVYIADQNNCRIRKVNTSGIISTVAGNGTSGYSGDGGAATAAKLFSPCAVAVDASGNLYIADYYNNRIRKVNTSGTISTIAGTGTGSYSGDGGAATAATIYYPGGVAVDGSSNVYFSDTYNSRLRKINTSGIISTIGGNGSAGYTGDGGAATSAEVNNPKGLVVDASGNIYFADYSNARIRKITTSGTISTVAGSGGAGFYGDGGAATAADLYYPSAVTLDATGNMFIADYYNQRIRKVSAPSATYCTPSYLSTYLSTACSSYHMDIAGFHLHGAYSTSINDNVACDGTGYEDHTSMMVVMTPGSTYTPTIYTGPTYEMHAEVWVDFNNDGSFDSTERIGGYNNYVDSQAFSLVIPSGAATGSHRMRLVTVYSVASYPYITPCPTSSYSYGETRDYTTYIGTPPPTLTALSSPVAFGVVATGTCSSPRAGAFSGSFLSPSSGNITVTAPSGFYVSSTAGGTYVSSYTISYTGGALAADSVYIEFCPTSSSTYSGCVSVSGGGASATLCLSASGTGEPACTGTPTAGTISATTAFAGSSTPFTVSLSGYTVAAGITFQWQSASSAAGTYSNIFGATNSSWTPTGITATTYYKCNVCCSYSSACASSSIIGVNYFTASSCTPNYANIDTTEDTYIASPGNHLRLNGDAGTSINDSVVDGTLHAYLDRTTLGCQLSTGSTYTITVAGGSLVPQAYQAWIDFNNNGTFESTESVGGLSAGSTSATSSTFTITIPSASTVTTAGDYRLRIATSYYYHNYPSLNACPNGSTTNDYWGETRDYYVALNVTSGTLSFSVSVDSVMFGIDSTCTTSPAQSFTMGGSGLSPASGNLTVYAPTNYAVCSTLTGTYVTSYNIPYTGGTLGTTSVYIKFIAPCTPGSYPNCLSITGGGLSASFCIPVGGTSAAACTSASAGAATVTPTTGGSSTSYALSVSGEALGYGTTFQWVQTTGGGSWTTITGATNTTYNFTGLSTSTCFVCDVTCPYVSSSTSSAEACVSVNIPSPIISTFAGNGSGAYSGDGGAATAAAIDYLAGVAADASGNVYFTQYSNYIIRKVNPSGVISTFAGNGSGGYGGDGGAATAAKLNNATGVATDAAGNVYIADGGNNRIRKVNTSGIITTFAGNGSAGYSGDGGPATAAKINNPIGVACDASGNVYIADLGNSRVRKVNSAGVITTFAGNGTAGFTGDGGLATAAEIQGLAGIAVNSAGTVYIVDGTSYRVRSITSYGYISTICGNGTSGYTGDNGLATAAELNRPNGVSIDASGNVYISDQYNNRIRKINSVGIITTYAGNGTMAFAGDGGPATAAEMSLPTGVCNDASGNLYISDFTDYRVRKVGNGNSAPTFSGGPSQSLTVCANTTGNSINTFMAITDADSGQTETWTVNASPAHGTLSGFTYTSVSDRGTVVPSGLTYTPGTGYSGADSFKVQVSDGRATATTTVYVTINPNPVSGTITGSSTICVGSTTTLADTTASAAGTWSSSNTSIASVSSSGIVRGNSVGTATISYAVTNSCSTSIALKTITVSTSATAGTISGAATVCAGSTIILSDSTTGGTWASSNSTIASVTSGGVVRGLASGSAIISYTVSTSCGTATATKAITVIGAPVVPAITGAATVCVSATTNYTDTTSGGNWTSSNTAVATVGTSTGVVLGVSAGTAVISYTVDNSCSYTIVSRTITVLATPPTPAAITGTGTVCTGATTTLSDTSSGGTWVSSATGTASVSPTGVVTGISAGSATITYLVSNSCGSASATTTVAVNAAPTAGTISGSSTVCAGATSTVTDAAGSGTWSTSNTAVATINTAGVVGGVAAGSAIITYTVTNSCGTARATQTITITPLPVAGTVSGTSSVCPGTTITLTDATSGGTWSSTNTAAATVSAAGVVGGVASGSTTISYTVTNGCGSVAATKTLSVGSVASAGTIYGPTNLCISSRVTVSDTTSGGTWSSSNPAILTVTSAGSVTGLSTGTAAISYTLTTTCGSATTALVMTVGSLPIAGSITGPSTVCSGTTSTFTDGTTGGGWISSNTAIATVGSTTGVVTGVSSGTVTISYYVSSTCATAIATTSVTVTSSATAGSITGLGSVCQGANITLTDAVSGGTWSSSNTAKATVTSAGVVHGVAAGSAIISYSITGSCGSVVATKSVTVNPLPSVSSITGPSAVCVASTITLADSTTGGSWLSSNPSIASVTTAGVVRGVAAGTVNITYFVTNSCGTSTTSKAVTVNTLSAGLVSGAATVVAGATITLTATVSGGTWSSVNTSLATVGGTGIVTGVAAGADTIVYSVVNSCGTATTRKIVTVTAHREELPVETTNSTENISIKVYPNPNTGAFTLEIPGITGTATILISDLSGRVMHTESTTEPTLNIDMNNYADGAYLLQVSVNGKVYSTKLIRN